MRKDENYSTFVNLRSLHYRMAGKQYCIKSNAVLYEGQKVFATDESGVRKMKGYYTPEKSGEVSEKPTGCLRIEVSNLPEFAELIEQAKKEADQLQKTLNSLSYFDLNIDFEVKEKTK